MSPLRAFTWRPMRASGRSHVGRVRAGNEDALLCAPERGLFAVIDGMGGEAGGEIAAALALEALQEVPDRRRVEGAAALTRALHDARARVLDHARRHPEHRGLGAVAVAARLDDDGRALTVAHAGDCRALLVSGGRVHALTVDHVEAQPGRQKGAVSRDLGRADLPADWVEIRRVPVQRGDLLVLCSDGLHGPVPEEELRAALLQAQREQTPPEDLTARLIALALAHGGPDNVTVVAARIARFSRRRLSRLNLALSGVLLLLLSALLWVILSDFRSRSPEGQIPAAIAGTYRSGKARAPLHPPPEPIRVQPGGRLILSGDRLEGASVALEIAGEAALERCEIVATGRIEVRLLAGARLSIQGCRLEAPEVALIAERGARVEARYALIATSRIDVSPNDIWGPVTSLAGDLPPAPGLLVLSGGSAGGSVNSGAGLPVDAAPQSAAIAPAPSPAPSPPAPAATVKAP